MPTMQSARHRLPYLSVSQAQKEITHNEALALLDGLIHPAVEGELSVPPALLDSDAGKCWLIGASPTGEWDGKAGQIACWIGGGWRYLMPVPGMRIRMLDNDVDRVRSGNIWVESLTIANPTGGSVIDVEARQAITTLLGYFREIGTLAI